MHLLTHAPTLTIGIFLLLAVGLALAFEVINGFHDTANAVATVIYTHSLPATPAVVWSGLWNLIGVLSSSGVVAYAVLALLPVDLVLNSGTGAGLAMVLALLVSAIIWNLGTWWVGLPAGFAPGGVPGRRPAADAAQAAGAQARTVPRARTGTAPAALDPRHPGAHLHRGELRPWLQ